MCADSFTKPKGRGIAFSSPIFYLFVQMGRPASVISNWWIKTEGVICFSAQRQNPLRTKSVRARNALVAPKNGREIYTMLDCVKRWWHVGIFFLQKIRAKIDYGVQRKGSDFQLNRPYRSDLLLSIEKGMYSVVWSLSLLRFRVATTVTFPVCGNFTNTMTDWLWTGYHTLSNPVVSRYFPHNDNFLCLV